VRFFVQFAQGFSYNAAGGRLAEPTSDDGNLFEPRMPEVDVRPDIEKIFDQARKAAAGENTQGQASSRQVALVTPGRMLMLQPCPPAGSMPASVVGHVEKLAPSKVKRKIAVIGYTELKAVTTNLGKAIPFFGLLSGMAYVGHSVWIFEGHPSAMAAGCKDADVLIVDGDMVPHLAPDWKVVAAGVKPTIQIYVHDRATHSLRRAT
jgi:hypothetical protein